MLLPLLFSFALMVGLPAQSEKLPIVFHEQYDISFWGLEKLHPFDSKKYGKVYRYLLSSLSLKPEQFYTPLKVTQEELLKVHTHEYLDSLTTSATVARIAEVPAVGWLPNSLVQSRVLDPMRFATGGTVLAVQLALEKGWSINLSGGYHHAKAGNGEGFCVFADIPLAIYTLWEKNPDLKVMIIDLDAHQGNGIEAILKNDPRIAVFDVYNGYVYPNDTAAKQFIRFNYPLLPGTDDAIYLKLLNDHLPQAIDAFAPDLIIYNAGTDILAGDAVGQLGVTAQGIMKRDMAVFQWAQTRNIPICMVLSGGYTQRSADIIGASIENIVKNLLSIR